MNQQSSVSSPGGDVDLHDGWLRVHLGSLAADFHYLWLRHNSDGDRHPLTGERLLDSSEIAADIRPLAAQLEREHLAVRWSDGAESRYSRDWLREHAYAAGRELVPPPPNDVGSVELHAGDYSLDALAQTALAMVRERGVVVVRGFALPSPSRRSPADDTEGLIAAFERTGLAVIGSHFGRIEDLRPDNTTNQNTDQLGYTDAGIELHTDQPFLEQPPRYQVLHAIEPAAEGGESFVVDARAAARYLHAQDEQDHALVTSVPVRFHRKQKGFERELVSPLVVLDGPRGFVVRFSYFTMAPHRLPFAQMSAWYRAYNHFTRIVRNPAHQFRFTLGAGDFVLYDNLRMLHGRTAFRGARWLRGIYLDS